jgi:hypothetical protein
MRVIGHQAGPLGWNHQHQLNMVVCDPTISSRAPDQQRTGLTPAAKENKKGTKQRITYGERKIYRASV